MQAAAHRNIAALIKSINLSGSLKLMGLIGFEIFINSFGLCSVQPLMRQNTPNDQNAVIVY